MADAEYARFEKMTNECLRTELKRRGCPISGNKKDLLARLRTAIDKDYEQNLSTPVIDNSLPVDDQIESVNPVMIIPEQISIDSEKESSFNNSMKDNPSLLDTSNHVETNTFVSKSHEEEEEEERNVKKVGEETHLPSVGSSSSPKSESVIKEIPTGNEQQHVDQAEINGTIEEKKTEVSQSVSEPIEQKEVPKQIEVSEKIPVVVNRSQNSSLSKISNRSTVNKINLTSELLRTLISDLSLLPESIVNAEFDSEETNESIVETNTTNDFLPSDSMTIGELADQKQTSNRIVAIDDLSTRKKVNSLPARLSSFESKNSNDIVTDEPVRIKEPILTHEPPSEILYIRGLTRPFSLMQLKGLLSRYGKLVDREFWLDKIKSQCFVTYETIQDAQNAREKLDGCRWPSTNPKTLSIRFARSEEFEYSKTHDLPPDHMSTDSTDRIVEESTHPVNNENDSKNEFEPIKARKEKSSGFLITDEEEVDEEEELEEPVKSNEQRMKGGLDDYFRKTKAKPCIYWLPLTEEQIVERTRRREERNAERDEEQRRREHDENLRRLDKRKRSISPSKRESKRH